jgi:hypothetical protein
MLATYVTGLVGIVLLAVAWVWVQGVLRRGLPGASPDPDPLAGRMGCHGCEIEASCEQRSAQPNDSAEEGVP